jgi:preprotein translocase subunit SecE
MNKLQDAITRLKTFIDEVRTELKKCSWPTKDELVESTVMVIVSVAIVGVFVGASDIILMGLLRLLIR